MPATYVPIATNTVTSATATFSFTSIPATYTDLVLRISPLSVSIGGNSLWMRFNDDTGTNYSWARLTGQDTPTTPQASSVASSNAYIIFRYYGPSTTINSGTIIEHNIMNYANTSCDKTVLTRYRTQEGTTNARENGRQAGVWLDTAAINKISILSSTGNIDVGTVITLFGIKAA